VSTQPLDELFAGYAGPWTEQEWAALPESMGRVELLDGALVVSPLPAVSHQRLVRNLACALEAAAPAGFEVFDGLNVQVGRDRIMIPDIVVLDKPGLDAVIVEPDCVALAVEVTPPSIVSARATGGRLLLEKPFPADLDLAALATATRYPGH
jgi:Uma2 family endonuclease